MNIWSKRQKTLCFMRIIMEGATAPFHNMFENLQRAILKIQIGLALAAMNLAKRHFAQTLS